MPNPPLALDIKAGSITLPILKLFTSDIDALSEQLEQKLGKAPEFFRNAPVVIELGDLDPDRERLDFPALVEILRKLELTPVGVRGGNAVQHYAAQAAKLAVLADSKADGPVSGAAAKASARVEGPTRLIQHPVRSGQRLYAAGGDLIVLAQVSPGAEIMADGNIHIYGSLKGRALAGVQGDLEARIFCSDMQAELVAIGGHYKISENLDKLVWGKSVQVYLQDNALIIEALASKKSTESGDN